MDSATDTETTTEAAPAQGGYVAHLESRTIPLSGATEWEALEDLYHRLRRALSCPIHVGDGEEVRLSGHRAALGITGHIGDPDSEFVIPFIITPVQS